MKATAKTALAVQNKAVAAIKAAFDIEFMNSDFDGDELTLVFNKTINQRMLNVVCEAVDGRKVIKHQKRIYVTV